MGLGLLVLVSLAQAEPYRPTDEAQILERIPSGLNGGLLRNARGRLTDPNIAATLARGYIERARREADPRDLGYAQGLLAPWWQDANPPLPVLLMRATLRQSRHDFGGALDDLDLLLKQRPDDAQALLTRATVLRVQGRYDDASASCLRLQVIADPFVVNLCGASVRGLHGEREAALQALTAMKPSAAGQQPGVRAWFDAELAELYERAGRTAEAEAVYQEASTQFPDDLGLRAAHADFLLDHARTEEALALAQGHERVDALRLRELLARALLRQPHAEIEAAIDSAFDAARLRNEDLHLREEARFVLDIKHDAARALSLAQRNWAVQHEYWDLRLLLASALAAGQPQAAGPALDWLKTSRLQDARIAPLLTQLGAP